MADIQSFGRLGGGGRKSSLQDQDGSASGSLRLGQRQTLEAHPQQSPQKMDKIMEETSDSPPLSLIVPGAASAAERN